MPTRGRTSGPVEIYEIKVTLRDSRPSIWRRIQVPSDIMLANLHKILQGVMGWQDTHLHEFIIRGEHYGTPGEGAPERTKHERKHILGEFVPGLGEKFAYNYDFGDYWQHILEIENTLPMEKGARYLLCLAGTRACPPEDVGGIPGYENFIEALNDPHHPEHGEMLEWVGGPFDPDAFDITRTNQRLSRLK